MAKIKTSVVFKQYNQQQNFLLPPSFDELIDSKHLVRVVNTVVDSMDISGLINTFTCPNDQQLICQRSYKQTHQRTGYQSLMKEYECTSCDGCAFYDKCCKSGKGKNRTIKVNEKLEGYKSQARENLHSEQGKKLRKRRSIEIESCFGDIKHNMGFRRFHLRGIKKVKTEFTLIAMSHNLRELYIKMQNKRV